jgi:uncharacterized membrane protein
VINTFISDLSGKEFPLGEKISAETIRPSILRSIKADRPSFGKDCCLSLSELNMYRQKYIAGFLVNEVRELSDLEQTVLGEMENRKTLVDKIEDADEVPTMGQRLADLVASFGGSWSFIGCFTLFMFLWIISNVYFLSRLPFDPYPFILLNLILSCLAALQAPIIMMSQNRQEEKDRARAKKDYMINLKSELEIRMIHEKLDHLIMHQQQELIEIQKIQVEMMNDIMNRISDHSN